MNREEVERLKELSDEMAQILYRNTPVEALENLGTIEQHLRQQWIEVIGPKVGFFLLKQQREQTKDTPEP